MLKSQLSLLPGVVRWSPDHAGMEFTGRADGRAIQFLVTQEALASMAGRVVGEVEYDFDAFFDNEDRLHRIAANTFARAKADTTRFVITPAELVPTKV